MNECVFCDKELENAVPAGLGYQPCGGGSIMLDFCFGSTKFDKHPGWTEYSGLICDDCAEKIVDKMEETGYGFDGEQIPPA